MPLEKGQILLCESSDGGTNCLMASPPDAIEFRYGERSFAAHQREAALKRLICLCWKAPHWHMIWTLGGSWNGFLIFWSAPGCNGCTHDRTDPIGCPRHPRDRAR